MQEKLHSLKEEARYLSNLSFPVWLLLWGRGQKKSTEKVNKKAKDPETIFVPSAFLSEFDKRGPGLHCRKSTKKEGLYARPSKKLAGFALYFGFYFIVKRSAFPSV